MTRKRGDTDIQIRKFEFEKFLVSLIALVMLTSTLVASQTLSVAAVSDDIGVTKTSTVKSDVREQSFNEEWKFSLEEDKNLNGSVKPEYDDSSWEDLTLPHDWSIYFDF